MGEDLEKNRSKNSAPDLSPQEQTPDNQNEALELEEITPGVKKLTPEIQEQVISIVTREIKHHSGPLPSPNDIARYNEHIPDGANRIMKMAENQSEHRRFIEKQIIENAGKQNTRGQIFAFSIGIVGIITGAFVALNGNDVVGGTIAGTTVISLVSAFIYGKRDKKSAEDSETDGAGQKGGPA